MENYVGKRIDGRYEIHEIIGVGGMAVVYKAYDNIDDRIVAIKILKEEYISNEEFRRRFKNESKYIAVLSHPNIVKVYDVSFGDRLQYIVMEYIEGITLKEYIQQQGVIQPREAVLFVTQILRALQHAHDKGIVHRDVKPQNIMLLQNGSIKVTDFGIASFNRSDTRTMSDSAIGSVHYISPEQAKGDFTDAKADIYSVGVVMYEMLTGTLPFQSDSAVSVALMQLQNEPDSPSKRNPAVPVALEQITMHAMQKDPSARYQSAAQMLLDIDEYKRNPDIKFDYSYFVDNEPTKFIDRKKITNKVPVAKEADADTDNEEIIDEIDDEQAQSNSKLIPILTGAVAGLGAVLVVILAVLFFFTDVFKSSEQKVPDFIGKIYETEIKDSSKYKDYNIEIEYEFSADKEVGSVIKQSPEKGEKIDEDDVILLTVNTNKTALVTDVYGQSYLVAKQTLEAAGFVTSYEMVYDTSIEEGVVINTSPERGDEAAIGSTVMIYVSSHTDANAIETPEIVGYSQEIALDLLKSVNLEFGEVIIEDSTQPEGTVIEQTPLAGDPIHEGEKVDIKVSSGKAPTKSVDVTVRLPYKNGNAGTLKVYLNNVAVDDAGAEVLLNSSTYSFSVSGSGKDDTLIVKIDGSVIYSCKIDFTADPIVISDEKTIDDVYYDSFYYGAMSIIPNVEGKTREQAEKALNNQGFYNITVETQTTLDNSKVGKVISQKPELNGLNRYKQYSTSTAIVIVIGKGVLG